jgi:hypothetical protein
MNVRLTVRHCGVHDLVDTAEVPGAFTDYATPAEPGNADGDEWVIDEGKLLAALPGGFLPVPVSKVLLGTETEDGGTAISGLKQFRRWAKYFDAYMLWLREPEAAAKAVTEARKP